MKNTDKAILISRCTKRTDDSLLIMLETEIIAIANSNFYDQDAYSIIRDEILQRMNKDE
jgi:hypothetical protein